MSPQRVVVDGSNIATEGRSLPSLVQLDEAVRAYREEHPDAEIIVVVDATFAHRIPEPEREMFEAAAAHNELVYPPAGAIGRGDAFLLRIADKTDAIVLSNDSFQEFHGEFDWLFTKGRLVGGTPVPGVGWIFVPRTPVRGPKSREAVKEAKRGKARIGSKEASAPMPVPKVPPPGKPKGKLKEAIEVATEEVVSGEVAKSGKKRRRKRKEGAAVTASLPTVNDPLTFIQFIADYRPGATVEGEVESFASHGAFVLVGKARCYVPLSAMGEPPPRSAREVLARGEKHTFVVQALDAPRRGIELALPGFARVAGHPTDETVEAEIEELPPPPAAKKAAAPAKRSRKKAASAPTPAAEPIPIIPEAPRVLALKAPAAKKKKAAPAKKKAAAKKAVAKKAPAAKKPAAAKKVAAKKAPAAKSAVAKSTAAKKAPAAKKAAVKKAPAKKVAAKKAPAKKAKKA